MLFAIVFGWLILGYAGAKLMWWDIKTNLKYKTTRIEKLVIFVIGVLGGPGAVLAALFTIILEGNLRTILPNFMSDWFYKEVD